MPTIIDIDDFKQLMNEFFIQRANSPPDSLENLPPRCTPTWFAVLFGILACSVQLASSEVMSEANRSRVFGKLVPLPLHLLIWPFQANLPRFYSMLRVSLPHHEQLCLVPQRRDCSSTPDAGQFFTKSSRRKCILVHFRCATPIYCSILLLILLTGLTIRLAQSLGLHCLPHLDTVDDPIEKRQLLTKQSLW